MRNTLKNFLYPVWVMVILLGASPVVFAGETIKLSKSQQVKAGDFAEFKFELKEIPEGTQVRLYMDARVESKNYGGHTMAMALRVNDKKVLGKYLINKPLSATCRNGTELAWSRTGKNGYVLMYAPDFTGLRKDKKYVYGSDEPNQDPFLFVWDISSLVNDKGPNVLKVRAVEWIKTLRLASIYIEIGGKRLPLINFPPPPAPAPTGVVPTYEPKPHPQLQTAIEVSQLGDIRFKFHKKNFYLHSRTSLPKGRWSNAGKKRAIWSQLSPGKISVAKWKGVGYTVERKIELLEDHISVKDTIRNTSKKVIGVMFENKLKLPCKPLDCEIPETPRGLVFARFKNLVVGMVAEDDIFRLQAVKTMNDKKIGLSDLSLGIGVGKAHTLEWSIYPLSGSDYSYWDLINVIRRNWGSNMTLKFPFSTGGYNFMKPNAYYVSVATFAGRKQKTATRQKPHMAHGTAALLAKKWCAVFKKGVEQAKGMESVRLFAYTHHTLCTEPGYWNKYKDSIPEGASGKAMLQDKLSPPEGIFVPTLHNSYGKALTKVYKYFADLGADIYIDEISIYSRRYDYRKDVWDGCSVEINPKTHALMRKRSNIFLLMQPWRSAMMKYLKSKGRIALANGSIITRTMLNWQMPCFVEFGSGPRHIIQTHLGTSWVWTYHHETAVADAIECLDYGAIITYRAWPLRFIRKMYPLTPIELRPGVVIGKERIITNRSGQFGWGDDSQAEVYVFDNQGKLVEKPNVKELHKGNQILTEVRMPGDHLAILVRKNQTKKVQN